MSSERFFLILGRFSMMSWTPKYDFMAVRMVAFTLADILVTCGIARYSRAMRWRTLALKCAGCTTLPLHHQRFHAFKRRRPEQASLAV